MKILVTGSEGFIGSHLVELLIHKGYNVKAFVLYNSFNSWGWLDTLPSNVTSNIEIFTGSHVLHLASLIAIPYSYHSPDMYVDTNIRGTLNILQAARDLDVERVIHTSTSEVYGTAQFVPITEDHPLQGQSPYSATKIAADQLALSFFRSFETPVAILRPFNTYGPRQSARAVIPTAITQIASGKHCLKLGSLHPTRDFTFVTDTASAFEKIMMCDEAIGRVLNAGSEFEISIKDTILLIAKIMGKSITIEQESTRIRPRKSEVERLFADASQLKTLTSWEPAYGGKEGFAKGLEKTIEWFSSPKNLKYYKSDIYNI